MRPVLLDPAVTVRASRAATRVAHETDRAALAAVERVLDAAEDHRVADRVRVVLQAEVDRAAAAGDWRLAGRLWGVLLAVYGA